ncbi:MAG TPA: hypothetical protein VLV86_21250 [Vicinamibacterales bacterium]|nr:hypothetical protein [Vicinamibacterales bacterium]
MKKEVSQGIGRREFIVMTSGTAVAAIAMGQVKLPFSGGSASPSQSYALGFAEADAYKNVSDAGFSPNVMPADRVTSGDGAMLRDGVRVSVRGFNVEPKSPNGRASMELIANYLTSDGGGSRLLPFIAWSYTKASGAGNPISFIVPVDTDQRLHLIFSTDAIPPASNAANTSSAVSRRQVLSATAADAAENGLDPDRLDLSLLSGDTAPKLRPGFYILAPIGPGLSAPDWTSLQLRRTDDAFKLYAMNGFEPAPAQFEYLILLLELAGKRERLPLERSKAQ